MCLHDLDQGVVNLENITTMSRKAHKGDATLQTNYQASHWSLISARARYITVSIWQSCSLSCFCLCLLTSTFNAAHPSRQGEKRCLQGKRGKQKPSSLLVHPQICGKHSDNIVKKRSIAGRRYSYINYRLKVLQSWLCGVSPPYKGTIAVIAINNQ